MFFIWLEGKNKTKVVVNNTVLEYSCSHLTSGGNLVNITAFSSADNGKSQLESIFCTDELTSAGKLWIFLEFTYNVELYSIKNLNPFKMF